MVILVYLEGRIGFTSTRWICTLPHKIVSILSNQLVPEGPCSAVRRTTLDGQLRIPVTPGAAQGSILGPDLRSVVRQCAEDNHDLGGYAVNPVLLNRVWFAATASL